MEREKITEHCESYLNGNILEFKVFIKGCSKLDMLEAIERLESLGERRHIVINKFRLWLED